MGCWWWFQGALKQIQHNCNTRSLSMNMYILLTLWLEYTIILVWLYFICFYFFFSWLYFIQHWVLVQLGYKNGSISTFLLWIHCFFYNCLFPYHIAIFASCSIVNVVCLGNKNKIYPHEYLWAAEASLQSATLSPLTATTGFSGVSWPAVKSPLISIGIS